MSRKFTSSLLAAAMALTSLTAAPAAAEHNRNFDRFIAGAGTILLLNHQSGQPSGRADLRRGHDNRHGEFRDRRHKKHGGFRNLRRAPLPGYCLRRIRTHHGPVRMFGQRCLQRNYRQADWLPGACRMQVRTWRHGRKVTRVGYHPRCLHHRGYRVDGRR
ncbi:hypothetical protein [Marinovum sp.]|uniref:hypothetical protein n=1 Tax=Marinovum sp. TaxID=2024839 RepID=UPI002B274FE1|nr:hypothetical protein [Marinovum sp.]